MSPCIPLPTQSIPSSSNHYHPKLTVSSKSCTFAESRKCRYGSCSNLGNKLVSLSGTGIGSRVPTAAAAGEYGVDEGSDQVQKFRSEPDLMPKHVAVIMDGNRRWALQKGLPIEEGHRAGGRKMREMAHFFLAVGVKVLTVFAFSTENWVRPKEETDFLMSLFEEQQVLLGEAIELQVRISVIGDTSKLRDSLRKHLATVERMTKGYDGRHLVIALNYGGRQDILQATKAIATKVREGKLLPEEINESSFEAELQTKGVDFPCPDLLIRSSGEKRISNFMLWQLAYTELHFVDKFFPDLEEEDFAEALISYQRRQRRFGGHKYE